MTDSRDPKKPMAEPGKHREGADVGGILQSADGGAADALQRKSERRDETARSGAATGEGSRSAPGAGAVPAGPGTGPAPAASPVRRAAGARDARVGDAKPGATGFDDEEAEDGPWRHEPVEPVDESPIESLGRSVSEVVTGPLDGADGKPKT